MPIYAYRCAECGHELDALQKISEPALRDCPSCGKAALAKKLTAPGFQLKGSGWYQTDFRNGSKPPAAAKDATKDAAKTEAPAGGGDAAPAKGDAKPDTPASTASAAGCGTSCSCH
jgi:putative FmdB family regulatory protein